VNSFSLCNGGLSAFPELPENVKHVYLSHNHILDWESPEHNPYLLSIDLSYNELTMLPNRIAKTIKVLKASHNSLVRLPRNLPNEINILDVSHNQIAGLPVRLPCRMISFDLSYNSLTSLTNITFPESLQVLYIDNNRIRHLN